MNSQIAGIAHQVERRKLPQHGRQSSQPAAHADVLLRFFMAFRAKRDEVVRLVGALTQDSSALVTESSKRDLVVHIVLPRRLHACEIALGRHDVARLPR